MFDSFRQVWCVDFEFGAHPGERPEVRCLVAREFKTGRTIRLWCDEMGSTAPYSLGPDCLFVAYMASAEFSCHLALGWPLPARILDLSAEFRNQTSGLGTIAGRGLIGALASYGLDSIGAAEKKEMQALALRGGPYTEQEKSDLLDYCETDVDALMRLLPAMLPKIDLPRALLRGRYMAASARMESAGVPIDLELLALLRAHWSDMKDELIARIDKDYGVYDGQTFKEFKFADWLERTGQPWPRYDDGSLIMDDKTFRSIAKSNPKVSALRELRWSMSQLRLEDLAVGADGRNRTVLWAFGSKTGRNQPSNTAYIFGPAVWLRGLIKPPSGHGVAYIDWSQQEFGIAAYLSGDPNMIAAYESGDPYLAFAKLAGAVPADATKDSHRDQRNLFKACVLAVQYGMGWGSLALRIGQPPVLARDLMRAHREAFAAFWRWSDAAVDHAMLHGSIHTHFGWACHLGPDPNDRSLRNFMMQATGAEMLRLAACLATECGAEVVAPVHDAFMICAPLERLDDDIADTRAAMAEASRIVLAGHELGTDVSIVRYPDRFRDKDGRGDKMWNEVTSLIAKIDLAKKDAA
jgi:DNA polymerase I